MSSGLSPQSLHGCAAVQPDGPGSAFQSSLLILQLESHPREVLAQDWAPVGGAGKSATKLSSCESFSLPRVWTDSSQNGFSSAQWTRNEDRKLDGGRWLRKV